MFTIDCTLRKYNASEYTHTKPTLPYNFLLFEITYNCGPYHQCVKILELYNVSLLYITGC